MGVENGNGNGSSSSLWKSKVEVLEQVDINTQRVLLNGQEVFRVTPLLERKRLERQQAQTPESAELPALAWEGSA